MYTPSSLHQEISKKFDISDDRITGLANSWATFKIGDDRINLTKCQGGYRITTPSYVAWKSSARAACNFIAKNI